MLNSPCFCSIVITLNNSPKYLEKLFENITNQGKNLGQYEIIFINNLSLKKNYSQVNNICLKYNIKNVQKFATNDICQNILDSCRGEIIVFIDANCYPDAHWLENLIKSFNNSNINIVAGEICQGKDNHKFRKIITNFWHQNNFEWSNFYDNQIANIAVRKKYLQQANNLNLTPVNSQEVSIYYRILREIEAEIVYNPSSIVYSNFYL
ncbi:glycosyltransferase [Geminocystis sp. CENA526]|uniref:glycosyltransferase n=1 Tax=Geminocystis sp. CENA526 TaxID=1355871 RepID=UPI003D6E15B2